MPEPYYDDGTCQIFHADCREILPELEGVDLVLTDPPYGVALSNHGRNDGKRRDRSWEIAGDQSSELGQGVIDHCLAAGWPTVAFASPRQPWQGTWRNYLVWHKPGVGVGGDPDLCWIADWELIQVANNGPLSGPKESAIIRQAASSSSFESHPAQKPVALLQRLILKCQAGTVLDPFMGSGSTLLAAKNLNRKAIGIEVEERYAEIAARRLQQEVLPLEVS